MRGLFCPCALLLQCYARRQLARVRVLSEVVMSERRLGPSPLPPAVIASRIRAIAFPGLVIQTLLGPESAEMTGVHVTADKVTMEARFVSEQSVTMIAAVPERATAHVLDLLGIGADEFVVHPKKVVNEIYMGGDTAHAQLACECCGKLCLLRGMRTLPCLWITLLRIHEQ